jgi:hypothetical protein
MRLVWLGELLLWLNTIIGRPWVLCSTRAFDFRFGPQILLESYSACIVPYWSTVRLLASGRASTFDTPHRGWTALESAFR